MINEKYSYKDFTNQSFLGVDHSEFDKTEIVGSNFYQESKEGEDIEKNIFPVGMTGVTFRKCNLDNVIVPVGNTVETDCTKKKIKKQNDLEDWILDKNDKPVEPVSKKMFERLGLSVDPKDLPLQPLEKSVVLDYIEKNPVLSISL